MCLPSSPLARAQTQQRLLGELHSIIGRRLKSAGDVLRSAPTAVGRTLSEMGSMAADAARMWVWLRASCISLLPCDVVGWVQHLHEMCLKGVEREVREEREQGSSCRREGAAGGALTTAGRRVVCQAG
jgi:hypothetical protein